MKEDTSSFAGRFKRYKNVSTALGGTAFRFMGEKFFGFSVDHQAQAEDLRKALGSLKGPIMKIGQFLATIPDAIPDEYAQEFLELQSNAPAMGALFVKRRMKGELGEAWQEKFKSFNLEASKAASLGQVHQAVALNGLKLACKLQYPDMMAAVEGDLKQLKLVLAVYEKTMGALSLEEVFHEISERLYEELDYTLEAKHIRLYQQMLGDLPFVHLPEVLPALSTKRLLTMTWLEGKPLKAILAEPQSFRNEVARAMFHLWYHPFYHYGIIHGDPHLGNYTFRKDGSVNLLDFGCIRVFSSKFVKGVLTLYEAIKTNNEELKVEAYKAWGFSSLSKELRDVLNLWASFLYEPLLDDRIRPIQKSHSGVYGREMAGKIHQELRRLGGVTPPREFVFMDRAAVGVGSVFMHLKAKLNWYEEFQKLIKGFDEKTLHKNQQKVLRSIVD
jgi:predicted unusual protein kinase regulating ubiquinone biosynthesis (AarF/ABC1/UbiB family)